MLGLRQKIGLALMFVITLTPIQKVSLEFTFGFGFVMVQQQRKCWGSVKNQSNRLTLDFAIARLCLVMTLMSRLIGLD